MKSILTIVSLLFFSICISAQESPYSIFGNNTPALGVHKSNECGLKNFDCVVFLKDGSVGFIEFDFKAKIAKLKDSKGHELKQTNITPSDVARFTTPDPEAESYPSISPYAYCAGNPIRYIDPSGCEIRGVTRDDAAMVAQDIRAIFPGDEFEQFRGLIVQTGKKQNGYSLAKISDDALLAAFSGITLNEDQQAMVDIVVNTINSPSRHMIEYVPIDGRLSYEGSMAAISLETIDLLPTIDYYGGLPSNYLFNLGGGITVPTSKGTHSAVINALNPHQNSRAITVGHEIFGHGRSLSIGHTSKMQQHTDAIQTENLILRMMGIPFINTGIDHGPKTIIPNSTALPSFR